MKAKKSPINNLTAFFGKIATVIVSGLPKAQFLFRPANKSIYHIKGSYVKPDSEKHYHKPIAKPVVEKQTLIKEKKKTKTGHL